ncbi:MAG: ribosomal protein S18-alanine N-acetyltransferase [Oscillospiraceae bacterium]|nr:ribosomal protein S18-alanine N-acetyltransferase [Oscillospiraceae bacterium]
MAEITAFRPEHIDAVFEIETESFGDPWSRRSFGEILNSPSAAGFIALEGCGAAGYLIMLCIPPEIEILNIAVKKSLRRKKIATGLFGAALEYAKSQKAERLFLEVRKSNEGALKLYQKLGFQTVGTRKNYYANPREDALLMSLRVW